MGFRVWGLGFRVQGSGFRVCGLGLGLRGSGVFSQMCIRVGGGPLEVVSPKRVKLGVHDDFCLAAPPEALITLRVHVPNYCTSGAVYLGPTVAIWQVL